MKMKIYVLCLLFGLGMTIPGLVGAVDINEGTQAEYELVARNFLAFLRCPRGIASGEFIERNGLDPSLPKIPVAYLARLAGGGYILISASRNLTPIKAYSLKDNFETLPPRYREYLLLEVEYGIRTTSQPGRSLLIEQAAPPDLNRGRWDFLLNFDASKERGRYEPNTFLLTARWGQKKPFNKFLPKVNDQSVKVGCASVAIAQLMKYHQYPTRGKGSASYTWNGQNLSTVFTRNYHWENMPDDLNALTPEYQQDEVAWLMRDIAIAIHTEFGVASSSATMRREALVKIFGYANNIKTMKNSPESLFFYTIRSEIDASRPVLLRFPGHMTVADGYSDDPSGRGIHVNFGWSGHSDGYYFLDKTVYTDLFSPFSTNPGELEIYYNLKPCSGADCDTNLEDEDNLQGITISGRFNTDYDSDEYKVYLKGPTIINGYRLNSNYQNRAFLVSILDLKRRVVISNDGNEPVLESAVSNYIAAGKYYIKISLCDEQGACFPYEDLVFYTAWVNTQSLTPSEKAAIDSQDAPPVIYNNFQDLIIHPDNRPYRILLNARDDDEDTVYLSASSTTSEVQVSIDQNAVLTITPSAGILRSAARITVTATARSKSVKKSFIVLVTDEHISFGKEFEIIDRFENQDAYHRHTVILEGNCTITGDNGYLKQGFYTSLMEANGIPLVDPNNVQIQYSSLERGYYLIGASLRKYPESSGGPYYVYQYGQGDIYTLKISCPEADDDIARLASSLGISMAGTGLKNPPTLSIDADKDCGLVPCTVQFASQAQDLDGTDFSYQWYFGDGAVSGQSHPSHTYTAAGTYAVQCTVTDHDGLTAQDTFLLRVSQARMGVKSLTGEPLEGSLINSFEEGRNLAILFWNVCYPCTSYDFLLDCLELGRKVQVHHVSPQAGSFGSTYWFFGRVSGKEILLPDEDESSSGAYGSGEACHIIDLDRE
ncbi:MAG: C10 family peptidase [bacterium]